MHFDTLTLATKSQTYLMKFILHISMHIVCTFTARLSPSYNSIGDKLIVYPTLFAPIYRENTLMLQFSNSLFSYRTNSVPDNICPLYIEVWNSDPTLFVS